MKTAVTTYDPNAHHDNKVGYYAPIVGRDLALFAGNVLTALRVLSTVDLALVAHDGSTRLMAEAFIEAHGRGRIVTFDKRKTKVFNRKYTWKAIDGPQPDDAKVEEHEMVLFLDDFTASGCAIAAAAEVLGRVDYAFLVKGHMSRECITDVRTYIMQDFYERAVSAS